MDQDGLSKNERNINRPGSALSIAGSSHESGPVRALLEIGSPELLHKTAD